MSDHRRLLVWQRSSALALAIHKGARRIPAGVAPGFRSQLLRASASIPFNIAEGNRKRTAAAFLEFVSHALGSASEVDSQLALAKGLALFPATQVERWLDEIDQITRMLVGLEKYLEAKAESEEREKHNAAPPKEARPGDDEEAPSAP